MTMMFPLYLLGALAIAVPLYLHLKRQPPKDQVEFSSLMFLNPTRQLHIKRRSKLENIFLLLLRCLAVLLLALIFARPFLADESGALGEGTRMVILVDTSASMRRPGLWEDAVERIEQELENAGAHRQIALHRFDRAARPIVDFEQWEKWPVSQRIDNALTALEPVKPGWNATDLAAALTGAADAIADAEAADPKAPEAGIDNIVVISDWQDGARLEALAQFEWPEEIQVTAAVIEQDDEASNASINWVRNKDATKLPQVRVRNGAGSSKNDLKLAWKEPGGGTPIDVHVVPGESVVVDAPPGPARDELALKLSGDDVDFDNELVLAPASARRVRILYIGDQDPDKSALPYYYIRRVFPESKKFKPEFFDGSDASHVADADLIIIAESPGAALLDPLRSGLRSGKRMLFLLGGKKEAESLAALTGLDASSLKVSERDTKDYYLLENLQFDHPMLSTFNQPGIRDFSKVRFWKYRSVDSSALPANASVVAKFDSGDPAIIELPVGKGSLAVFTSGWHPRDSQLARSTKFLPLLFSVFHSSTALDLDRSLQMFVGDRIPRGDNRDLVITAPDGSKVTPPTGDNAPALRFEMPGIYRLGDERIGVNLPPSESQTAVMPLTRLEPFGVRFDSTGSSAAEPEESAAGLHRALTESRQKYWQWLVIAVLVLLIVETWIASRRSKVSASSPNANSESEVVT